LIDLKRINRRLNDLEALAGIAEVQARPSHLEVDFSSLCNYRCLMCHQSKLPMGRFALREEDIDTLVDSLPYVDTVMIAGLGEPLLYPHLDRFLPHLERYGCHTHLYTNGELIHRHLGLLAKLDRVSVSLDGATPETFETLRVGGSFERVVSNLRALRAAAPSLCLVTSTVVSKRNLREVADIVALAGSLSMQEVHLSPVDHTPAITLDEADAEVFRDQLAMARKRAPGVRLSNNIGPQHFRPGRNASIEEGDLRRTTRAPSAIEEVPELPSNTAGAVPRQFIHGMDPESEAIELHRRLDLHSRALVALRERVRRESLPLAFPYCSAPWKYAFARSRGDARLCPYADIDAGRITSVLGSAYNSSLLTDLRASMHRGEPCLSVCRSCTDDHRHFRRASLRSTWNEQSSMPLRLALRFSRAISRALRGRARDSRS
jgi:MoaA/NifB/PqqE/SkfB family radical SAM enzyme